ncbi:MAG: type II toxin-antitoxin system RelE/ParE family toxin [Bdellovibrio sp.]|nr:type II toxin-antitoxin system RelE/ParE family toxin [Bdellovibrio sp.]
MKVKEELVDGIYLVHAFQKKTNKTPQRDIEVSIQRIKRLG